MAIDFSATGRWYHRFPGGWIGRPWQWYQLCHPVAKPSGYGKSMHRCSDQRDGGTSV